MKDHTNKEGSIIIYLKNHTNRDKRKLGTVS